MAFARKRAITIDATKVGGATHTDFPMLFGGTYTYLKTVANGGYVTSASGYDIAFFADANMTTPLSFELVAYAAATGVVEFWVKIPSLSSSSNTTIYIAYGDSTITTNQSSTQTWNSDFKTVLHMQEISGGNILDSSQSDIDADLQAWTIAGGPVAIDPTVEDPAKISKGLDMEWVNQYNAGVAVGLSNITFGSGTSFTIECWVYIITATVNDDTRSGLFGCGVPAGPLYSVNMTDDERMLKAEIIDTSSNAVTLNDTVALTTGTWYHISITFDTSDRTLRLFKNGVLVTSGTTGAWVGGNAATNLNKIAGRPSDSMLDEFRMSAVRRSVEWLLGTYNSTHSPSTFYSLSDELATQPILDAVVVELALGGSYYDAVLANNPVGFWLLGEHLAVTGAQDHSGNNRDGTYIAGMLGGARGPFPHGGTAMVFNGTTNYVTMGDVAAFEFTGAFSVEFLFKTAAVGVLDGLIGKGDSDIIEGGWRVYNNGGPIRIHVEAAGGADIINVQTTLSYTDDVWHHCLCTWDGTTGANKVQIYIDGALVKQGTANAGTVGVGTRPFTIGAFTPAAGVFNQLFAGSIVGVAVYNAELTSGDAAAHYATLAWTDITADVLTFPWINIDYGTQGTKPLDRLADSGTLELSLNNSAENSAGLSGYYSPNHTNVRSGFTFDIPIRVRLIFVGKSYDRFWGRVAVIDPEPGQHRSRATNVVAHDYMYVLADTDARQIPAQLGQTETSLIRTVFDSLPINTQPMALDLDTSVDVYTYAFDDIQSGVKAATALNKVITSAWGRGFVTGDGTFQYRNRQAAIGQTIELAIDNDMMELISQSDRSSVFNHVRVVTHPKAIDAAATAVLYSHPTAPLVPANGGVLEFFADYVSPNNELQTVGGTAMVTPVSGTDFIAHEFEDGTGTLLTGSVTATASFFASAMKWRLVNNHATLGAYFTTLQARGKGIYDLAPVTSEAPIGAPQGSRPITLDLPYQDDANAGQELAEFILNEREAVLDPIESITVGSHRSVALMTFIVECEPGTLISVSETQTGLSEAQAMVRSIRLELRENEIVTATIRLIPSVVGEAWELDVDQLDISSVLGYA